MQWAREMARRLSCAVNGEKDRIIAEYQALTGKSPATLYRIASRNGFSSGRRPRRDKGACNINDQQLQFISSQIQTTARDVKGPIMPVGDALELAETNGVIAPGQISEARLAAILREREMNKAAFKAVTPSIKMRSLHPNHVHVFDASICIQYYLKGKKRLGFVDERDFRIQKPKNYHSVNDRLFRMILVDHFSHCIFVKYYVTSGENAAMTFDFLSSAWRGGHHDKLPFRGVPKFLLMDAGSANRAKGILNFLERLDVEIPKSMPHNPRRQGSAEVAQNIVECHFEAKLRLEPATSIEELNAWAVDWMVAYNALKIHRRHKMPRTTCWLKYLRQEHLRDLPDDAILRDLYAEPEAERTVRGDNTISFRSEEYRLKHIPGIGPGKKVRVVLRPYHWPEVAVVFNDTEYLVRPIEILENGFQADAAVIGAEYKAQPETPAQKAMKVNHNLAFGSDPAKEAVPFGGTLQVFGHQADKVGAVPMPRRGTPIEIGRDLAAQQIPIMALFKQLRDADITISTDLNRELRETFGDSVPAGRADEIVRALSNGEDWHTGGPAAQAL